MNHKEKIRPGLFPTWRVACRRAVVWIFFSFVIVAAFYGASFLEAFFE